MAAGILAREGRGLERRTFTVDRIEVRTLESGARELAGYAAVFGKRSENLGGFYEELEAGAFESVLGDDCRLLINHDGIPLARTVSGTLTLSEDAEGLAFSAPVDDSRADVGALISALERGDINQCSFGFCVRKGGDRWSKTADGELRTIKRGGISRLLDVSVVTFPAYPDTTAEARGMEMDGVRPETMPVGRMALVAAEKREAARPWLGSLRRRMARRAAGEAIPATGRYGDPAEGSLEDWLDDLARALNVPGVFELSMWECAWPLDTFGVNGPGYTVALVCDWWDGSGERYYKVEFDADDQGEPVLGATSPLMLAYVPATADVEAEASEGEGSAMSATAMAEQMEMNRLRMQLQEKRFVGVA